MKYNIARMQRERILKGLSQTDLARAINKTPAAISRIESGAMNGSPKTIKDIADILQIPMEQLIIDNDNPASSHVA